MSSLSLFTSSSGSLLNLPDELESSKVESLVSAKFLISNVEIDNLFLIETCIKASNKFLTSVGLSKNESAFEGFFPTVIVYIFAF